MRNFVLSMIFIVVPIFLINAQQPILNVWKLSTGTATYEYYPGPPPTSITVNMTDSADVIKVCSTSTHVYVHANSLGSYLMGPWLMNPNVPVALNNTYKFPLNPQPETGAKTSTPFGGPQALAIDGVIFYPYGDAKSYSASQNTNVSNGDGNWNSDAWITEGATLDPNANGHADMFGTYHLHANPKAHYTDPSSTHSPIVGFSFDGYPIYGPFGYSNPNDSTSAIERITSSYQLRNITTRTILPNGQTSNPAGPNVTTGGNFDLGTYIEDYEYINGSGHLDQYNGRNCITPEYPGGTYAYFITTKANGDPSFPYVLASEYYGQVAQNAIGPQAGNETIPGNAYCGTFTSVAKINKLPELLNIYPNPSDEYITIDFNKSGYYTIQLSDLLGSVVYSNSLLVNGLFSINIKNIERGAYIVRLTNENTNATYINKLICR
ncbi:MAG: YHYH protein [Saprospiraceae bacterium]|nr:YHYH protein [Saprospiraceae bacterium]